MAALTCGLEIHQQLDTNKLFCNCVSNVRDDAPVTEVRRVLRAVVGETGVVDVAAAAEAKKRKFYVYEGYDENSCFVEFDEAPPRPLNQEALKVVLTVAKMLNAVFLDAVQFMRKTIVDGSNTSGFQRTALVAVNGKLKVSSSNIGIPTVILEEDSARIIRDSRDCTVYRLDRLSIPLIEISTSPDIHSGKECVEVAEKLGMLLRSTGCVKRGLGTIRQDVNVSVEGGARVEVKGCQDLKLLEMIVETEANRQRNLLFLRDELRKRKVKDSLAFVKDVSSLFSNSDSKVIQNSLKHSGVVLGLCLPGFAGFLGREVAPKRRFGTELSDRAKIASGVGGVFHSDELPNYGISEKDVREVRKALKCSDSDAFVLVADEHDRSRRALDVVRERAFLALEGVPGEVRRANDDGTSSFLRPMPGAARMYPETDIPLVMISDELLQDIRLPELIDDKIKRYEHLGLGKDLAVAMAKSDHSGLFEELLKLRGVKSAFIAEILVSFSNELLRTVKSSDPCKIKDFHFRAVFTALDKGQIAKESVKDILADISLGKSFDLDQRRVLSDDELLSLLRNIVSENKGLPFNVLIGKAMAVLRGKAQGSKVVELLKQILK
jgi:glutamyl-tRNA(Gln) amidotransferase subunit E